MGIRPFSWGKFGMTFDPPEPPECDGIFEEDRCRWCSEYAECKAESEDEDEQDND